MSAVYKDAPFKTFIMSPVLNGKPQIFTSNISAFVQTHALTGAFYKPANDNRALGLFGENVVFAEGDAWKRHRRVTAPAFGTSTMRNVWQTTASVYTEIISTEGWHVTASTPVVNVNKVTHKVSDQTLRHSHVVIIENIVCALLDLHCRLRFAHVLVRA